MRALRVTVDLLSLKGAPMKRTRCAVMPSKASQTRLPFRRYRRISHLFILAAGD